MRCGHKKMRRWLSGLLICLVFFLMMVTATHAEKEIKIGIIGPMKFLGGEEKWWGATMAAEEINVSGGVLVGREKYKIELVKADSNELLSLPDAVNAMGRLMTVKKVDFVVGGLRSETCLAMQEVMADYKKIWIAAATASPKLCARVASDYQKYKYFFKLATINSLHVGELAVRFTEIVAAEVREKLGVDKPRVAILVEKLLWADPIVEAAQRQFPKIGTEVVGIWRPSATATDATAELTAIKNSRAHMIFCVTGGAAALGSVIPKQWGELKVPACLFGISSEAMTDQHWVTTKGLCNYEATHNYFGDAAVTPKTIPFIKKFKERFKRTPTNQATPYDALYVLKDAIERAGTLETDAVIAALEKTDYVGAHGRIAFYPKDHPQWPHDVIFGPKYVTTVLTQWRDGRQVVIWPDGKGFLGDESWVGVRYGGTENYQVPPWVVEYWKGRK